MQKFTPAKKAEERIAQRPDDAQANTDFIKMIQAFESQIKLALPRHLSPSKMTRIIMTEVRKEPKLASCDRTSFLGALITCAQLGLEPGAALGHAYLLPYWNSKTKRLECQLIIGYQGKIDVAERDGRITINASVVYEKDTFDWEEGDSPFIKHKPFLGEDPGPVIASYAVARYADGRKKIRVVRMHEILAAKAKSPSGSKGFGPWISDFAEMAMKTAIHRLFKQLPKNPEMARVTELSDKEDLGDQALADAYTDFRADNSLPEVPGVNDTPAIDGAVESEEDAKPIDV